MRNFYYFTILFILCAINITLDKLVVGETQEHLEDEVIPNVNINDIDDEDDDVGGTNKYSPGDPRGPKWSIDYGQPCIKSNAQACKFHPDVQCILVVEQTFVCRCDFLNTWNVSTETCVRNVYAPCSVAGVIVACGPNMECRNDSLGIVEDDKYCRCNKGYKVVQNDDLIPAFCMLDGSYQEQPEEIFIKSGTIVLTPSPDWSSTLIFTITISQMYII